MATKNRETDYLYATARIRALETRLATKEKLERLLDAPDAKAVLALLGELGFTAVTDAEGKTDREETLLSVLRSAVREFSEMFSDSFADFWRYPYDVNNIKSVLKARRRGIDPRPMLFDIGTVSPDETVRAIGEKDYSAFPKEIAQAIGDADEAFSATGNPQKVDLILDRACYGAMLSAARDIGGEYPVKLVKEKIDLTNLVTAIRVCRMKLGKAALPFLREAILPGGNVGEDVFFGTAEKSELRLYEVLSATSLGSVTRLLSPETDFQTVEKITDNAFGETVKSEAFKPFGTHVVFGYFIALETEVKNVRMILAGKDAGLDKETVRERLRDCYV